MNFGFHVVSQTSCLAEMTPAKHRGKFIRSFNGAFPIGSTLAGLIAYFLVPGFGWRILSLIGALPALMVSRIGRRFVMHVIALF